LKNKGLIADSAGINLALYNGLPIIRIHPPLSRLCVKLRRARREGKDREFELTMGSMAGRSKAIKFVILGVALAGAIGYLFVSGMKSSMVYYLTLEELSLTPPRVGEGVRLAGWVKEGSISGSALEGGISFIMTDGEREMPVNYAGQVPDTFEDGAEVIVEGIYRNMPQFDAATMLAKCPSKYEAGKPGQEESSEL
jgi:cytochrome c-type biogenesis protein CcmE